MFQTTDIEPSVITFVLNAYTYCSKQPLNNGCQSLNFKIISSVSDNVKHDMCYVLNILWLIFLKMQ
jgi:hypothetical protein